MENPIFYKTVSTKNITIGQRYLRNHNKLLWQVEGADGVKTGYTRAAGRILVSSATRDGRRLVAVTINAPDDWRDHAALLNQGFADFKHQRILSTGDIVGFVEIAGGQIGCVQLLAAQDFDYALTSHEAVQLVIPGSGFVYAPVTAGADAGFAHVCIDGKSVGKVPLYYGETIEKIPEKEKSFWERWIGGD
jgi:D-alanyl-D-alanine carboxypeptidase